MHRHCKLFMLWSHGGRQAPAQGGRGSGGWQPHLLHHIDLAVPSSVSTASRLSFLAMFRLALNQHLSAESELECEAASDPDADSWPSCK